MIALPVFRTQIVHSRNPYIHKFCGCIHLRMGATVSCVIWAGLSLYFAIMSIQGNSPFYSYINSAAIYTFGTINLIFFGITFSTLFSICFVSYRKIKNATFFIFLGAVVVLIDMLVNTILFIISKDNYVNWCINSAAGNLDSILRLQQIMVKSDENNQEQSFKTNMDDFYNCSRTWEDELKFSVLATVVMGMLYSYCVISLHSYCHKLRIRLCTVMTQNLNARGPMMGSMMSGQGGPMIPGADILLQ